MILCGLLLLLLFLPLRFCRIFRVLAVFGLSLLFFLLLGRVLLVPGLIDKQLFGTLLGRLCTAGLDRVRVDTQNTELVLEGQYSAQVTLPGAQINDRSNTVFL